MKFNLKRFAKKSQDIHSLNEKQLEVDRDGVPEVVTEKQLDKDRVEEKEVTTEKQLEKNRNGGSFNIIERDLNESKSKLVQHRNSETYKGDINKVEEQRISKAKTEDEKPKDASSTPPKMRWWEDLKAASTKKVVTAQGWKGLKDTWQEEEGLANDGDLYTGDTSEEAGIFDVPSGSSDLSLEEFGSDPLTVDEIKPVDTPLVKGLYVAFDVSPDARMGIDELQEMAYQKILEEGYEYLDNVEGFTPASFSVQGDRMIAKLIGDEYFPQGSVGDLAGDLAENPFNVTDIQETAVEGVVIGNLVVDAEMLETVRDMEDEEIRRFITEAISANREDVMVEADGIDIDNLESGEVSFVGEVDVAKKRKKESWENVTGDPIASTDFDIVVLSQVEESIKKN